jgi:hypothetical protein
MPTLIAAAGEAAGCRLPEYFADRIHTPNTRQAYRRPVVDDLAWCEGSGGPQ